MCMERKDIQNREERNWDWLYNVVIEIEYKCKVQHVLICEIRVNM